MKTHLDQRNGTLHLTLHEQIFIFGSFIDRIRLFQSRVIMAHAASL